MPIRVVTWNVNSVRARLPRLLPWLEEHRPEVCCLQETKCVDEVFPREPFEDLGYQIAAHGQKTYNGVAILSRVGMEDVVRGLPGEDGDADRRVLRATVGDLMIVNLYVVNGKEVGDPKYDYKLRWLEQVRCMLAEDLPMNEKVVVCGDFNVTFDDRDIYDPERWRGKILCSDAERESLNSLLELGLHDAFRYFTEEGEHYTWWDFRTRGFERGNRGLRIDHFLVSAPALEVCTGVEIDTLARGGAKPSDHAPVIASFSSAADQSAE